MKKAVSRRIINVCIVTTTITALLPFRASAKWYQNSDRTWSYLDENTRVKGWKNVLGIWYYLNTNGIMQTGWVCDSGNWYYLNSAGEMKTGWIIDNEKWYYLNYSGVMQTGWIRDDGKWYYADSNGAMKTGAVNISDKLYYFNELGELQQTKNYLEESSKTTTDSSAVDVNGLPQLPNNYSISVQASAESQILELMNEKRTEAGLKPLMLDSTLVQIARYKSDHMIQYNYFDHTTPEGNTWTSWLDAIGYQYMSTGENIAYNNYDPVELFNQWWNSPEHKANMMKPSYNKVGIGVINGNGKCMGTQTFSN